MISRWHNHRCSCYRWHGRCTTGRLRSRRSVRPRRRRRPVVGSSLLFRGLRLFIGCRLFRLIDIGILTWQLIRRCRRIGNALSAQRFIFLRLRTEQMIGSNRGKRHRRHHTGCTEDFLFRKGLGLGLRIQFFPEMDVTQVNLIFALFFLLFRFINGQFFLCFRPELLEFRPSHLFSPPCSFFG